MPPYVQGKLFYSGLCGEREDLCKIHPCGVSAIQVVSYPWLCLKTTELQLLPLFTSFFPEAMHRLSLCYTCVHIYWCIYSHRLGANKMLIYYGLKFAYFIRWQYSTLSVVPGQPFLLPFHWLCLALPCDWLGWWNRLQVGQRDRGEGIYKVLAVYAQTHSNAAHGTG